MAHAGERTDEFRTSPRSKIHSQAVRVFTLFVVQFLRDKRALWLTFSVLIPHPITSVSRYCSCRPERAGVPCARHSPSLPKFLLLMASLMTPCLSLPQSLCAHI